VDKFVAVIAILALPVSCRFGNISPYRHRGASQMPDKKDRTPKSGKRRRPYLTGTRHTTEAERQESSRRRHPTLYEIMDRVSRGDMTPEEGAAAVAALNKKSDQ
jgi:hypothetical protein